MRPVTGQDRLQGQHGTQHAVALLIAASFLVLVAAAVSIGRLPVAVFVLYAAASGIAFVVYALDKSAARRNQRRIQERTLHVLALVGGWPGALLAQRLLRHKSRKQSFLMMFWVTVVLNCATLAWLLSPYGGRVDSFFRLLGMSL